MKLGPVRRALAAACLLPLLLAGCSDAAPTPAIPDQTTSSPSPSADETETGPVEPTLPPEAEGDGKAAAAAFVEHYFQFINYAQATGDTAGLKKLGLPSCEACNGGLEFIDEIYERGGSNTGGDYTVLSSEVTGRRKVTEQISYYFVDVEAEHTKQVVEGAGDLDRTFEASQATWRYEVVTGPQGLRISQWSAE